MRYTQYVKEHYTLEELGEIYRDTFDSYGKIYLPAKESYARKLFFQFYDHFLNEILAETQTVFPDLSMEVRLDVDPVRRLDGTLEGAPHDVTFPVAPPALPVPCSAFPWDLKIMGKSNSSPGSFQCSFLF